MLWDSPSLDWVNKCCMRLITLQHLQHSGKGTAFTVCTVLIKLDTGNYNNQLFMRIVHFSFFSFVHLTTIFNY